MSKEPDVKDKITKQLIAEIDPLELACIIVEKMSGMKRPTGQSAAESLAGLDPYVRRHAMYAAQAAAEYFTACINKGQTPN